MGKYVYCRNDFEQALEEALKGVFGNDGSELNDLIVEKAIYKLENYVNIYRFYARNCPGCVAGNSECDFAFGRNEAKGSWEKAKNGMMFDCPCRTNGTLTFCREEGMKSTDISDRGKPAYPIVEQNNQPED